MIHENLGVTTVRARITLIAPTFLELARSDVTEGLGYLDVGVA